MEKYNLQNSFKEFCNNNNFEINDKQLKIINLFNKFINPKKNFLTSFFNQKKRCAFIYMETLVLAKQCYLIFYMMS